MPLKRLTQSGPQARQAAITTSTSPWVEKLVPARDSSARNST